MTVAARFAVNSLSYSFDRSAADCVRHLAEQGYAGIEIMMYPGHLWPADSSGTDRRELRRVIAGSGMRLVALNMPNVDINIAGASAEMRTYSLGLVSRFVELAGDLEAPGIVIGPGKANPLFPMDQDKLVGHFFAGLDVLAPIAARGGTRLLLENMPFAFVPDAPTMMDLLGTYGDERIGIIYDVCNAHFIGEDACEGLRLVAPRLGLVHVSDTDRSRYKHDAVGRGDVPVADYPAVLAEIGYRELQVMEVFSRDPDRDYAESAEKLAALDWGRSPGA